MRASTDQLDHSGFNLDDESQVAQDFGFDFSGLRNNSVAPASSRRDSAGFQEVKWNDSGKTDQDFLPVDPATIPPLQREALEKVAAGFGVQLSWDHPNLFFWGPKAILEEARTGLLKDLLSTKQEPASLTVVTYPPEWIPQTRSVELVDVKQGTPEWNKVAEHFGKTVPLHKLRQVQRVQNKLLWKKFANERETIGMKGGATNERLLFHGTKLTKPEAIYHGEEGFDMRVSNNGMWGAGIYFAAASLYSVAYAHSAARGLSQFFLASVITGDTYRSQPDNRLRMPPTKPSTKSKSGLKNERYDSVCGSSGGSDIFIVYDNRKAYPSYLISFAM